MCTTSSPNWAPLPVSRAGGPIIPGRSLGKPRRESRSLQSGPSHLWPCASSPRRFVHAQDPRSGSIAEVMGMRLRQAMRKRPMSIARERKRPAADPAGRIPYVLEEQVGFLLRCAHQSATEDFNAVMGRFAVTPTQFAALAKLDDLGSVSQNQLGRLTRMDPATISGVVGRLIARGFVRQSPHA